MAVLSGMALGWLVGVGVGVVGLVVGLLLVKALARLQVPWWKSLVAPAVSFGPALGLLVGTYLFREDLDSILFWKDACLPAARFAWSVLAFFTATAAYGIVRSFLESRVVREEMGVQVPQVFLDLGRLVVWVVMAFVVVGVLWRRSDLFTALFTAGAVSTIVLGLALQDTIKNFISAWAIVGEGVYKLGDWVFIGTEEGEVVSITRRTTKIRTRQGDVVTFPNGQVIASHVRNESRPTTVHAEFVFVQAPYETPPNRVKDTLRRAILEVPKVLAAPGPVFRVHKLAESFVEYQVKFWLTDIATIPDIKSDVLTQIWYRFRREGIDFPAPVRELRRRSATSAEGPERRAAAIHARLKSVPFFGALPDDLLNVLACDAGLVQYGAGERVVQQKEPGDSCYVVDSGRLAVLVSDGSHDRQVAVLQPGDLFGELSLLTGEPRSATVRTLEDTRMVSVGSSALRTALEKSPELAERLAEVATLRREGLLQARAELDAEARAHVAAQAKKLGELILRFFRLPERAERALPPVPDPRTKTPG